MKKLFFSLACVAALASSFTLSAQEAAPNPHHLFVLYGAPMDSLETLCGGEWILIGELSGATQPDNYYKGFIYPFTKTIVSCHREIIDPLTAGCVNIIIDGEEATREQLAAIPSRDLWMLSAAGPTLWVETSHGATTANPIVQSASLAESAAAQRKAAEVYRDLRLLGAKNLTLCN